MNFRSQAGAHLKSFKLKSDWVQRVNIDMMMAVQNVQDCGDESLKEPIILELKGRPDGVHHDVLTAGFCIGLHQQPQYSPAHCMPWLAAIVKGGDQGHVKGRAVVDIEAVLGAHTTVQQHADTLDLTELHSDDQRGFFLLIQLYIHINFCLVNKLL